MAVNGIKRANFKIKSLLKRALQDESAQTTVEYMLLLVISVGLGVVVIQKLIRPIFLRASDVFSKKLEKLLGGSQLHYFPVSKKR